MTMKDQLHTPLRLANNRADTFVNAFDVVVGTTVSVDQAMPIVRAVNVYDDMLAALMESDKAHAALIHWTLQLPPHLRPPKKIVDATRSASRAIEAAIAKAEGRS